LKVLVWLLGYHFPAIIFESSIQIPDNHFRAFFPNDNSRAIIFEHSFNDSSRASFSSILFPWKTEFLMSIDPVFHPSRVSPCLGSWAFQTMIPTCHFRAVIRGRMKSNASKVDAVLQKSILK